MQLTIEEAATKMGKTIRQIRYLIQQDRITARKDGGRWLIDSDSLPASDKKRAHRQRREERLRQVVDDTLHLQPRAARFSLADLKAMRVAAPLYHRVCGALGDDHEAARALRRGMALLACGCHRYDHAQKIEAYQQGRDQFSLAACALFLCTPAPPVVGEALALIEVDLLPAVAGLLRRLDRGGAGARRDRPAPAAEPRAASCWT